MHRSFRVSSDLDLFVRLIRLYSEVLVALTFVVLLVFYWSRLAAADIKPNHIHSFLCIISSFQEERGVFGIIEFGDQSRFIPLEFVLLICANPNTSACCYFVKTVEGRWISSLSLLYSGLISDLCTVTCRNMILAGRVFPLRDDVHSVNMTYMKVLRFKVVFLMLL